MNVNAELPRSMETVTIADLLVGETAYTAPWAMYADQDRKLWLNPGFTFEERPGGTSQMQITRTSEGFRVGCVTGETYRPDAGRSSSGEDGLPVIELFEMPETDDKSA